MENTKFANLWWKIDTEIWHNIVKMITDEVGRKDTEISEFVEFPVHTSIGILSNEIRIQIGVQMGRIEL